jgi:ATP-binding cassette subfamily B multidrug efflux pump
VTAQQNKKGFNTKLLARIYALAKPYKAKVIIAVVLVVSMALVAASRPYLIQYTIDNYIATSNQSGLFAMGLLLLFSLVLQTGMQVGSTILTNFLGQNVIRDLRLKVYDYLTGLKLAFYDKTPVGSLVTRTVNDIETIADVFSEGLINIMGDLLQIFFILIFMFAIDWRLTLVSLSVLPFLLYAGYVFKESVRKSFEEVRTQVSRLNTFVQEHIQGMQIVQVFNREKEEQQKFEAINLLHRNAHIKSVFAYSLFFPVVEVIVAISTALVVWYGSTRVLEGAGDIGVIAAFILYTGMFFRPIRQLADRFNTMQMGMVAAERIFQLIDDKQNIQPDGNQRISTINGHIQFDDVWFAYKADEYVLKGISLEAQAGKTIALVGATGAGKSSIINLLSRFYEIDRGNILVDGIDIRNITVSDLRKHIALVLQDVFLFSGSVMDNIKLNNKSISDDQVIEVAKLLGAHDFISKLPDGYYQEVHERGATLSVGQRQLISFVRAMVNNPKILVLDEATSSVDNETELVIQQAIEKMMKGRTSIVIAHRLSTIQHADEIIVLDKGVVVERGTHHELLLHEGYYSQLHKLQFTNEPLYP